MTKLSGGDAKWHYIDRQNLNNSCGPACIRMIVKMMTGTTIGEAYFTGLVSVSEQGQDPTTLNPLSAQAQSGHDFQVRGSIYPDLLKVLKNCKIAKAREASATTANWGDVWKSCSEKTPAMTSIAWDAGGAHSIVIAGPLGGNANKILVLDPHYGVQQLDLTTPTVYEPRQDGGSTGRVLGKGSLSIDPGGTWVDALLTG